MWYFQWMLSLIPDSIFLWITYGLMGLGLALYVASKLVSWIPLMGQYKLPVELIGVIVLVGGAFLFGGYGVEMSWRAKVAELQEQIKVAEAKSQEVKVQIQERVVYKTKVVKERETVYVDKIIEIAKEVDAKCEVDPRVIEQINKAAEDPFKGDKK
jgi:hypothetical protein